VATVVEPFTPPAMRTMLFESNVTVSACTADGNVLVAVQVVVPFQSSAELSVLEPLFPPASRTCPFSTSADGSSNAAWSCRAVVIVPADAQLPDPEAALKSCVVFKTVDPLLPPVTSTLPFANAVAVCPSRVAESAVRLLQVDVPSKSCTLETLAVPEFPPTTSTLLLRVPFDDTFSRVAVWNFTACGIVPVAVQVPVPELGL
jgi:hypothetical protein